MISLSEKEGIKDILAQLSDEDIFSLLKTMSANMITKCNRADAIDSILSCTAKSMDLLKRQKIKKCHLMRYLHQNGVSVSADALKTELVIMCLQQWNSYDSTQNIDMDMELYDQPATPDMGIEFARWFFEMLNELRDFKPDHFWDDCTLTAKLNSSLNIKEESMTGSVEVVTFLSATVRDDGFLYHVGDAGDSIVWHSEPHGLIKILIRGVVHRLSNPFGLFDSAFGLVKNPAYDDNYKIKFLLMQIQVTGAENQHMIC